MAEPAGTSATTGAAVRVLVAEDQSAVRAGLVLILRSSPGIEVAGEAADGEEAVRLARELRPDVVLMAVQMPRLDGVSATRLIVADGLADVLVLTTFDLDEYVFGALRAGASVPCEPAAGEAGAAQPGAGGGTGNRVGAARAVNGRMPSRESGREPLGTRWPPVRPPATLP